MLLSAHLPYPLTGKNECVNVETFQATANDQVFVLNTSLTQFCMECGDPSGAASPVDIFWTIDTDGIGKWNIYIVSIPIVQLNLLLQEL